MEKIEEYKIQLTDAIIESCLDIGLPVNLNAASKEADILVNSFVESAISKNKEANEMYIDMSVSSAINSYRLISTLPINDRILFVNGINMGTQLLADMKEANMLDGKTLQEKTVLAFNMYESLKKDVGIKDSEEDFYTKLGIKDVIEIMHNYNNIKSQEKKKK